jgi:hypothetical protein
VKLVARPVDEKGVARAGSAILFQSRNPQVATVSGEGMVTAVRSGKAVIAIAGGGTSGEAEIIVAIPRQISLRPTTLTLVGIGAHGDLQAAVLDENGETVPDQALVWSTDAPAVVDVSAGALTARGMGSANVTAAAGPIHSGATIVVEQPPFESLRVGAQRISVRAGEQVNVAAQAVDAQGATVPGVGLRYRLDDEEVAQVDAAGVVRGIEKGRTRLVVSAAHTEEGIDVEVLAPRKVPSKAAPAREATERSGK